MVFCVVVCGGLRWFVVVCGGLRWFVVFSATPLCIKLFQNYFLFLYSDQLAFDHISRSESHFFTHMIRSHQ